MLTMTEQKMEVEPAPWKPDAIPVQDPDAPLFGEFEETTEAEDVADAKRGERLTDRIRRPGVMPKDATRRRWDNRHEVPTDLSLAIDGSEEDREQYVRLRLGQGLQGRSKFLEDSRWAAWRFLKPDEGDRDYGGMLLWQNIADKLDARGLMKQAIDFVKLAEA